MPTYRTTDVVTALRIDDESEMTLQLKDLNLFASGAFSNVYRGTVETASHRTSEVVIKKTWPRQKGLPLEVKILKKLNRLKHKNIVQKTCLALVFEYIPLNLYQFLKQNNRRIGIMEVKMIVWQLFRGQFHLQRMDICHRDIKPQNLLFNAETGLLKISDFGSSALDVKSSQQPSYHVTRYYRPPELLLGARIYGPEIDVWSCGCVFGELLKGAVFLPGRNSSNQAELVFDLIGPPTNSDLKELKHSKSKYKEIIANYVPTTKGPYPNFQFLMSAASRTGVFTLHNNLITAQDMAESVAVLSKILVYSPLERLSGHELLISIFSQLFTSGATRSNGQKIEAITARDYMDVKIGDKTVTGSVESVDHNENQ
ncbi:unnamed protein product [Caenorhabditis auriculariae]|uniref:Protein kinase domain-containing protein n=1 Tax=Caenorhabditis auriculariae TaxID=2777116 RepID=A0A8S1H102_9PELO|nr:unnamed protein product [Caenorhabditis auriculariae]